MLKREAKLLIIPFMTNQQMRALTRPDTKKKIALVTFTYPMAGSALPINSAALLTRAGFDVHVFMEASAFEQAQFETRNAYAEIHPIEVEIERSVQPQNDIWERLFTEINRGRLKNLRIQNSPIPYAVRTLRREFNKLSFSLRFRQCLKNPSTEVIEKLSEQYFPYVFEFYLKLCQYINQEYRCIISVDAYSLIISSLAAHKVANFPIPVLYYNMELPLTSECLTIDSMVLKALERECSKRCALTIIQDEERARLFGADNHIPQERIMCVPIAGLRPPYKKKSDYLRIRLGIPPEKRIILYAGNIADWSMSYEIAEAAQTWTNDLVLVLHTYMTGEDQEPYVTRLKPLTKTKKVYLSLDPVKWEVLPELLASANIGLAFYKKLGKNFYHISRASNKLVQYSQVGLPVITSDFPNLVAAVEGNDWGKCAEKPAEIERLANEIFANYEFYRNNAYACYQKNYSIEKYFSPVIDAINNFA